MSTPSTLSNRPYDPHRYRRWILGAVDCHTEAEMTPVQGSRQSGQDVTYSRRHSECLSFPVRPTYHRSMSDGQISYCGHRIQSQTDRRQYTRGHFKDCEKRDSVRYLCSVLKSQLKNAFEHCLLYKLKTPIVWCERPYCLTNINSIATYLIIISIIGCVLYDIRLSYIILHLWIITGLFKDVQNINVCRPKDNIHLYENDVIINSFKHIGDKSRLHWSFKDNLSWLWQIQSRNVSLEVFPSSLNLYFQNSENKNSSESMNMEWLRLESFAPQRSINVRPIRLARAGFYYTGTSDEVRCYSCGKRRSNWEDGEDPTEIHKQISPGCRHVNGTDDRNIAIPRDSNDTHSSESSGAASQRNEGQHFNNDLTNMSNGNLQHENCRGNHQHRNTQSRNVDTYQENPSLEQHASEGSAVPTPVSQQRQQYPHVANHMTRPTQFTVSTPYSSVPHGNLDFRAQHLQANLHENNQSGLPFEQRRASNGYNTSIAQQTNVNSSPVLNQRNRRSAHNTLGNNTGSTSASGSVSNSVVSKLAPLGVNFDKPKYPAYAVLTVRMSSFKGWSGLQTPNLMSEAGFVYAGYADYTRCFFCGGGLRNWETNDDPWVEHARWFPGCAYLRQNKGAAFIRLVHERMDAEEQVNDQTSDKSRVCESPTEEPLSDKAVDNLPAFQSIVEQGYSPVLARQVVRQLWTKGISNVHSTDILKELLRITEVEDGTDDPSLETTHNEGVPDTDLVDPEEREIQRLVEENRRLKREKMCRICEEEDASIAFLPCAHLVCCHICAQAVRRCPVCGIVIQGTVKTWFT